MWNAGRGAATVDRRDRAACNCILSELDIGTESSYSIITEDATDVGFLFLKFCSRTASMTSLTKQHFWIESFWIRVVSRKSLSLVHLFDSVYVLCIQTRDALSRTVEKDVPSAIPSRVSRFCLVVLSFLAYVAVTAYYYYHLINSVVVIYSQYRKRGGTAWPLCWLANLGVARSNRGATALLFLWGLKCKKTRTCFSNSRS